MNEEIDVSGCVFYSKGKCNNPNGMACNCCNNVICYFKELKRLEQENAKLKEKYQEELTVNTQLQEWQVEDLRQIAGLKRELEQANEWNKTLWQKLEKIKEFILHCYYDDTVKCNWSDNSVMPNCEYINECNYKPIDYLLHNIIEGAEDE